MKRIIVVNIFFSLLILNIMSQNGMLSSQIGYDVDLQKCVYVRSDNKVYLNENSKFELINSGNNVVYKGNVEKWGHKWDTNWWIADFSDFKAKGEYKVVIIKSGKNILSESFKIAKDILWNSCYKTIIYDFLKEREKLAYTKMGWKDCGSDLQEFSSHVVCVDGLCDILDIMRNILKVDERTYLLRQIEVGGEYLAYLQDKANKQGLGNGAVVHESRQTDVVTGNVAKAAYIFARISNEFRKYNNDKCNEYLDRSIKAYKWIESNGPVLTNEEQTFFSLVHGAPDESKPVNGEWMTRDLITMCRASVEIYKAGKSEYKDKAIKLASQIIKRQVSKEESEDGLYGHFYLYDDFTQYGNVRFTEKGNIHCGAWSKDGRIYNKGGHYPHYILPLIEMTTLWSDDKDIHKWRDAIKNFAYGYFKPACDSSPFGILPAGYYHNEGLLHFGSWYHAHNNIYGFASSLATEFYKYFNDKEFLKIATSNVQWIAGLNCGIKEKEDSEFKSISMISGIGKRNQKSWSKISGSVCNGFSSSPQFRMTAPNAETDIPKYMDDEGYLAHSIPFISALARLKMVE